MSTFVPQHGENNNHCNDEEKYIKRKSHRRPFAKLSSNTPSKKPSGKLLQVRHSIRNSREQFMKPESCSFMALIHMTVRICVCWRNQATMAFLKSSYHRFSPMAVVCLSFSRGHLKPQITVNGQMQTYRSEDILSDTLEFKKFVHLDRQLWFSRSWKAVEGLVL